MTNIRRFAVIAALATCIVLLGSHRAGAQTPVVTQKVMRVNGHGWTFVFRYPELSVPGALMGVRGIMGDYNRAFRAVADKYLARFKKDEADIVQPEERARGLKSVVDAKYTVLTNRQGLFSVKWDVYQFFARAAHPDTIVITSNWINDTPVKLADLFVDSKAALKTISEYAKDDVRKQFATQLDMLDLTDGASPTAQNYESFGIRKQGLHIFFQRGQVAAGACGNISVSIPWQVLRAQLKPEVQAVIESL